MNEVKCRGSGAFMRIFQSKEFQLLDLIWSGDGMVHDTKFDNVGYSLSCAAGKIQKSPLKFTRVQSSMQYTLLSVPSFLILERVIYMHKFSVFSSNNEGPLEHTEVAD